MKRNKRREAVINTYSLFNGFMSLTKLILDPKYRYVSCNNNYLTKLKCNDNLLELDCSNNKLTELKCNKNLKSLDCSNNYLTELKLNDKLESLTCYGNHLTTLKCNDHLNYLHCSDNNLTELELNDGLEKLICFDNKLTSITYIPSSLRVIECFGNNFDFATKLRLIKWYFQDKNIISYCFTTEIDDYKKYLVLLLQLNTYIIKYL